MVIVQFHGRLVHNIGLVLLILWGLELRVLYHCTMCTRHPNLVSLDFYAIHIYSHSNLNIYLSALIFNHNS